MKILFPVLLLLLTLPLHAQSVLESKELERTLTADEFAVAVKEVWDELKKYGEESVDQQRVKNEFETTPEYHARVQKFKEEFLSKVKQYDESKNLASRSLAVLFKANLVRYDADAQTYSLTTSTQLSVPPDAGIMHVSCPPNSYISIIDTTRRGYKFTYLALDRKPEYTWHVGRDMAKAAKQNEGNIYFKVWFRLDLSQPLVGDRVQLIVVPTKIALLNKADDANYWNDTILK